MYMYAQDWSWLNELKQFNYGHAHASMMSGGIGQQEYWVYMR